jgi:hypothetical protein
MKRGQAALEFLLTYGWAIMVVIAVLAGLSYFGVLDVTKFTTKTCISSGGLACYGKSQLVGNEVVLSITNLVGFPIILQNTSTTMPTSCNNVYFCDLGNTTCTASSRLMPSGMDATIRFNCNVTNNLFKGTFMFDFTNSNSGLVDRAIITVRTRT